MAAPKGHSGYKKVGDVSKKTEDWNSYGKAIVEYGVERSKKIMESTDDEKFIRVFFELLKYFKPQLSRSDVNQNNTGKQEIIIRRESNDSYPPIIQSTPGTASDPDEPKEV